MINGHTVVAFSQTARARLALEILEHLRSGDQEAANRKMQQRDEIARWQMRGGATQSERPSGAHRVATAGDQGDS